LWSLGPHIGPPHRVCKGHYWIPRTAKTPTSCGAATLTNYALLLGWPKVIEHSRLELMQQAFEVPQQAADARTCV
jgi:hypothetical protein